MALGASAARGAGPGPQDRAEFLLLASPVKFFPAADPEAKILAELQLRLIRGPTLLEAPSPSSFSKEFCSKSSSHLQQRRQQQEQQEQQHLQERHRQQKQQRQSPQGGHSLPNSRSTRENEF